MKYILVYIALFTLSSCIGDGNSEELTDNSESEKNAMQVGSINLDSFPTKIKIESGNKEIDIVGQVIALAVIDTFLVCVDLKKSPMLHVIGLNSFTYLGQAIGRGRGPGEFVQISRLLPTIEKHTFWGYDISLRKFMKINILEALNNAGYVPEKEIALPRAWGVKAPVWINDSTFAGTTYARDDCRFIIFNDDSEIISKIGKLPEPNSSWPASNPQSFFPLNALCNPASVVNNTLNESQFAVAYKTMDLIELYKGTELVRSIKGPDHFKPIYKIKESANGFINAINIGKTKFAHIDLYATKDYIISLYSGRGEFKTCGSYIFIFDWDGKPVKSIFLEEDICSLGVTPSGDRVYYINQSTGGLTFSIFDRNMINFLHDIIVQPRKMNIMAIVAILYYVSCSTPSLDAELSTLMGEWYLKSIVCPENLVIIQDQQFVKGVYEPKLKSGDGFSNKFLPLPQSHLFRDSEGEKKQDYSTE